MRRRSVLFALISSVLAGCKSLSPFADRRVVAKFDQVDSIEVLSNRDIVRVIDDAATISRMKSIYENAKWRPWMDTMPSGGRRFVCKAGDDVLFELIWVGWLIEWEETSGPIRKATLEPADSKWLMGEAMVSS